VSAFMSAIYRMTHCSLCGQDIHQMAERGAYLERTSPKGGPFVGECRPSCDRKHGTQDDALIAAIDAEKTSGSGSTEEM
jgi:hypothetical protein